VADFISAEFYVITVLLIILAAVFIFFPIMLPRQRQEPDRRTVNVELFQTRLAELEQDQANGVLDAEEYQRLKLELERRLLEDTEREKNNTLSQANVHVIKKPSMSMLLVCFVIVGVVAIAGYQYLGAKADWDISRQLADLQQRASAGDFDEAEVQQLMVKLSDRLEQRPDNAHYLMLLGSMQMERENYPAATEAYQRLAALFPGDSAVLARYAQALYLSSGRNLTAQVEAISKQVLSLDPAQPTVLGMLGIANFESGDIPAAIDYWTRMLPSLGPVSPNRKMIEGGIAEAKRLLQVESGDGESELVSAVEQAQVQSAEPVSDASITIDVAVGDKVKVAPETSVFVFARAATGPAMPLAVKRMQVSDLPVTIVLDDSMAMAPGMNLSSFAEVEVVARISLQGSAIKASGDIEGVSGPVQWATFDGTVSLVIDQVLP
jgi:cytochrome c-type biogenesis protein CcmH